MHRLIEIFIHHTKAACVVATLALSMALVAVPTPKPGRTGPALHPRGGGFGVKRTNYRLGWRDRGWTGAAGGRSPRL